MQELITTAELARVLGVSPRWIQREMRDGGLPFHRIGRMKRLVRFDREEVLAWARTHPDDDASEGGSQ